MSDHPMSSTKNMTTFGREACSPDAAKPEGKPTKQWMEIRKTTHRKPIRISIAFIVAQSWNSVLPIYLYRNRTATNMHRSVYGSVENWKFCHRRIKMQPQTYTHL